LFRAGGVFGQLLSPPDGALRRPMQCDREHCYILVEAAVVDRISGMRRRGESYSEVLLRLVELDAARLRRTAAAGRLGRLPDTTQPSEPSRHFSPIRGELLSSSKPGGGVLTQLNSAASDLGQFVPHVDDEVARDRGYAVERRIGAPTPPPEQSKLSILEQTLGPPSPFVTIPAQSVVVHFQLGQQVFHCLQFRLDGLETGKQGGLQPILRLRRAETSKKVSASVKTRPPIRPSIAGENERFPMVMRKGYPIAKVQS
jgi:hypothetical protein